jgi:hypothetical protein
MMEEKNTQHHQTSGESIFISGCRQMQLLSKVTLWASYTGNIRDYFCKLPAYGLDLMKDCSYKWKG